MRPRWSHSTKGLPGLRNARCFEGQIAWLCWQQVTCELLLAGVLPLTEYHGVFGCLKGTQPWLKTSLVF